MYVCVYVSVCLSVCLSMLMPVSVCLFVCAAAVLRSDVGQGSSRVREAAETRKQICQERLEHC